MTIQIGLDTQTREKSSKALIAALADTYTLYMQTHGYHWNVTGRDFNTLHTMFEEQYTEMWQAIDEIAERIRALGVVVPATGKAFSEISALQEDDDFAPAADVMVQKLLNNYELIIKRLREQLESIDGLGDTSSEDILTQRLVIHEKTAWMLRSFLA